MNTQLMLELLPAVWAFISKIITACKGDIDLTDLEAKIASVETEITAIIIRQKAAEDQENAILTGRP